MGYVLCIVAAIAMAWVLLMASAGLSLRRTRRFPLSRPLPRLIMAVVPVIAGAIFLALHLRFTVNNSRYDLSLPFVFPITLGLIAVIAWFRGKEDAKPPPNLPASPV